MQLDPSIVSALPALLGSVVGGSATIATAWLTKKTQSGVPARSARERGILELVAQGQSNKEIGRTLSISPETVKTHLDNVYGKLAVQRRAQAIARAKDLALLAT
jgi:ATP/maltotriose-dependent transcriptional regulator MalT